MAGRVRAGGGVAPTGGGDTPASGHTQVHRWRGDRTARAHGSNTDAMVCACSCSPVRRHHWGGIGEGHEDLPALLLQFPVNLQLFQDERFFVFKRCYKLRETCSQQKNRSKGCREQLAKA